MKDETKGWQSINKYSSDDLKEFLGDGHNIIVHVAGNPINGNILFANYYHQTGFSVCDGFGGELKNAAITHWMYEPELPY